MFYEAENAFDTLLGLEDTHNGPHLSFERTAENCAYDHFHAKFGIYQFGCEWKLRSDLTSGLSSCKQI